MSGERVHRTRHSIEVAASAGALYALLADGVRRPLYCPSVLHVERLDFDGARERLRVWEDAGGSIRSSFVAREQYPHERRIAFQELRPAAPVESMGGEWTVEETAAGGSVVTVRHAFTVLGEHGEHGDDADEVARVTSRGARAELESLRRVAESRAGVDDLVLAFEESVWVNGPGELVYDFLYRAADWPGLLPHVRRLRLTEPSAGLQLLDYAVALPDGAQRETGAVRLCFPHAGRIVYKETAPAAPVAAHTGEWSVLPGEHGVRVVAQHRVLLDADAVRALPGSGVYALGPASRAPSRAVLARHCLRESIGRTSLATLALAKRHAESAVRSLPRRPAVPAAGAS
ncbi:aromatase/cyclase [Streptomyces sp. G44]|uniref:aromatase/cyclase n=1 Tax=Streptomyces sp. G44 TaxID=2807632 RepID=UPI00196057CA|nr:aromatase/cyclase [Streptomyces sp. G44]MBM7170152.1 aromatase/cyclase [Streptomyces sp. G44]